MQLLLQQMVNGLGRGALIALFAVGFSLIFSKLGILNVAHGTFATWGAVFAYYLYTDLPLNIWVCVALGAVGAGVVGMIVDTICFQPLRGRSTGIFGMLITSIGAWIISLSLAQTIVGPNATGFPPGASPPGIIQIGSLIVLPMYAIDVGLAIAIGLLVWGVLRWSSFGSSVRAIGHDPRSIAIAGTNPRIVVVGTAFLAAGIAGLAGALEGLTSNNVSYNLGENFLVVGFCAVVIGGYGSVIGAVIGGFVIGMLEVLSAQYISSSFRDAIVFSVLFAVLVLRPKGLFAEAQVSRA